MRITNFSMATKRKAASRRKTSAKKVGAKRKAAGKKRTAAKKGGAKRKATRKAAPKRTAKRRR